jgi:gas vesicle protein
MPSRSKPEIAQKTAEGHDLPAEAKEKLLDLANALDEFIRQQQKVIQSSAPLAKKPADNFTPQDEKLLKDLQAVQDKWEKFLNEQFADFSKLAQQDFSKPSLLKELVSIKTDVTMAKDALQKKATEIATAIEDNGIENAQTLTTNIEKWLPDEPDRIKWSMEDTAEQTSIEQAELPKELEDLVGDLLEQEEDLFEEMEDVTSKYAQSGDKGIGWDAMDGPISNMNAQGVTGNQLPNTSEISGRSGEGRQGKATGEFVEDKAVGKGGRRTPTRLTPEPFQQGQINDTSAEPAGGATGGGKLSGAGGEGLEGPVPPPLAEQMKRLAGRHAQLLNRAERAQAAMKVSDFSNYQFLQTITLMNRVQGDLENYRYANVLRQKPVLLSALKQSRDALTGRIDVTADTTGQLSQQVRDDIADAMRGKLPPEFQEALQRYFLRLSESGGGTGVPPVSPSTRPAGK